jgi:hypothetical protein
MTILIISILASVVKRIAFLGLWTFIVIHVRILILLVLERFFVERIFLLRRFIRRTFLLLLISIVRWSLFRRFLLMMMKVDWLYSNWFNVAF